MSTVIGVIKAVVFDIDQTLWDFHATRINALTGCLGLLRERATREVAQRWTVDDLQARFDRLETSARNTALGKIRTASLKEAANEAAPLDARLGIDLHELYFDTRHAAHEPFPDVVPALHQLRDAGLQLGLVSNGNSNIERLGLDGWWDAIVLAPEHGVAKPHPAIYEITAGQLGRDPSELVCVGDDPDKDVAGPQRAGWRGIWNRRDNEELPSGVIPDATVELLTEIPQLLRQW